MYSGDVPAILSARKTYSFSRNRIHPPPSPWPSFIPIAISFLWSSMEGRRHRHHPRFRPIPLPSPQPFSSITHPARPSLPRPPLGLTTLEDDDDRSFFVSLQAAYHVQRSSSFSFFFSLDSSSTTLPFRTDSRIDKLDELKLTSWCSNLFGLFQNCVFFL